MSLQITPNTRAAGNLNITANQRARMSSLVAIDWGHVTGKPNQIVSVGSVSGTGIIAITDTVGGSAARTVTGTANEITLTNGNGVSGNPVVSLPSALTFTSKTITGGTYTSVVSINGNFWTAGTGTLTLGAAKTATISNTLTFTGTDGSSANFGAGGTVAYKGSTLAQFAATTSAELLGVISDETGSGALVFANTPTLVTPVLGVASATSINKVAFTAPATSATLTIPDGVTLTGPAASGTAMTLGNVETVTGAKTFNDAKLILAGSSSGTTTLKSGAAAGSSVITLPIATDTLVGKATTDILTNKTLDSAGTGNVLKVSGVTVSAGQFPGETGAGSATAGNIGEYVESIIVSGSAVAVSSGVAKTITSISLTAGDWDVDCSLVHVPAASTSITTLGGGLSLVTNTIDTTAGRFVTDTRTAYVPTSVNMVQNVQPYRFSLSGTTTIYMIAFDGFTVSTMGAWGILRARRVR